MTAIWLKRVLHYDKDLVAIFTISVEILTHWY